MPDVSAVRKARQVVRGVFKHDPLQMTLEDRKALHQKMMGHAADPKNAPELQYATLLEVAASAALSADADAALWVDDELDRRYPTASIAERYRLLDAVARKPSPPPSAADLADGFLAVADRAASAGDFALAGRAATRAGVLATRGQSLQPAARAKGQMELFRELAAAARAADKGGGASSANAAAFLCAGRGDWDAGLAALARCDDPALAALANRDLAGADSPKACTDLGDGYLAVAAKTRAPIVRLAAATRAAHWYREALPDAAGGASPSIEKRLAAAAAAAPWLPRQEGTDELSRALLDARWTWNGPEVVMTFTPDGSVSHVGMHGKYEVAGPRRVLLHISNGDTMTLRFNYDLTRYTSLGRGLGGDRLKGG